MNLSKEILEDELDQAVELAKLNSVRFAYLSDEESGSNIQVMGEKVASYISESVYIEALKTQLEKLESISYTIGETEEVTLADKTFLKLNTQASMYGITMKQYYYVTRVGEYLISIIVTDTTDGINLNSIVTK
jgi:hypothetical protein